MNKRLRSALMLLLSAAFLVCIAKVVQQTNDYHDGSEVYTEAMELSGLQQTQVPERELETKPDVSAAPTEEAETEPREEEPQEPDPYVQALAELDLAALQEVNSDVIGWISIPDTVVSYPLLQGEDNDYYLHHTWNKETNSVGSIFMEHLINADLSEFNTLIYGHKMRNGSMFGGLKEYENIRYWEEHPTVYVRTAAGVYLYDIYAAYEAKLGTITYGLQITEDSTKQTFIQHGLDSSMIDTGIIPTQRDRILTLVTCTGRDYSGRWVVQAVLRE